MGGARNLKLGGATRGRPGNNGAIFFVCGRNVEVQGQSPWLRGQGQSPPSLKLKHLAFGHAMVAANLTAL